MTIEAVRIHFLSHVFVAVVVVVAQAPFCFPDYRDNRALADDIGGFFRRKINNIRNELGIVRAAIKEEDKVEDDSVVMESVLL